MVLNVRNPNHPKSEHKKVRISNGFGFRAFGIRALTVYRVLWGGELYLDDVTKKEKSMKKEKAVVNRFQTTRKR